jgi:hypothetical protein
MNDNFEYSEIEERFGKAAVAEAVDLARAAAFTYPPSYYTSYEDFEPRGWVVAAIASRLA